ncbi:MAG: DUF5615 family PIN-like protein [Ktedonobacterales bacterium]
MDENTTRSLVPALRNAGYPARHVVEVGLQGHSDPDVSPSLWLINKR